MRHLTTAVACLIASVMIYITACNMAPIFLDPDIVPWPEPVTDTCETPEEITEPAFIQGYIIFDQPQDSILWQCAGLQSYDLGAVIEHILPGHPYRIHRRPDRIAVWVWGTNDAAGLQLAVWTRITGSPPSAAWLAKLAGSAAHSDFGLHVAVGARATKWYMGWASQAIMPHGTTTAAEHLALAHELPSVDRFNFINTHLASPPYDSLDRDTIARVYLGNCKAGRTWADFRYAGMWDTVLVHAFYPAGWEQVLQ